MPATDGLDLKPLDNDKLESTSSSNRNRSGNSRSSHYHSTSKNDDDYDDNNNRRSYNSYRDQGKSYHRDERDNNSSRHRSSRRQDDDYEDKRYQDRDRNRNRVRDRDSDRDRDRDRDRPRDRDRDESRNRSDRHNRRDQDSHSYRSSDREKYNYRQNGTHRNRSRSRSPESNRREKFSQRSKAPLPDQGSLYNTKSKGNPRNSGSGGGGGYSNRNSTPFAGRGGRFGNKGQRPTHVSQEQRETEHEKLKKWVAEEDVFALKQMKHGALIRIKEGRSKPIDWLAANLRFIEGDPSVYDVDFDVQDVDFEIPVPFSIIENLNLQNLEILEDDISKYVKIDKHPRNSDFWEMMLILCKERKEMLQKSAIKTVNPEDEIINPVSDDIDAMLKDKSYSQLVQLEKQVKEMKNSKDPSVDIDFWSKLLKELVVRKAKARLTQIYDLVITERLRRLNKQQHTEALRAKLQISQLISKGTRQAAESVAYSQAMDDIPPMIPLDQFTDEGIKIQRVDVSTFLKNLSTNRAQIKKVGFLPMKTRPKDQVRFVVSEFSEARKAALLAAMSGSGSGISTSALDISQTLFDKDDLPDVGDNEEQFNSEDNIVSLAPEVGTDSEDSSLQKPRFYNRVILGYEWNRYNQTHYTSENPPPKIVQGYKFNIFYPDLIDAKQAPGFSIIRDSHKTNKQLATAAGQNDTCIIKFHAGPPYQDIAFKVVDRQWDNSSHRGSRCKFENGVLQVHFRFKRVFYRK